MCMSDFLKEKLTAALFTLLTHELSDQSFPLFTVFRLTSEIVFYTVKLRFMKTREESWMHFGPHTNKELQSDLIGSKV